MYISRRFSSYPSKALWCFEGDTPLPSTSRSKWKFSATPPSEVETTQTLGGEPLHNGYYDSYCHHPTMHLWGDEGCAGAAVTALVARKKGQVKKRWSVCVCAQKRWISAKKQHQRHTRASACASGQQPIKSFTSSQSQPPSQREVDEADN